MTKQQQYMKEWRSLNRDHLREYQRGWYRDAQLKRHKRLSAGQLDRCRKNPRLAGMLAGPRWVVCLECGLSYKRLDTHLARLHGMKISDYRAKYGVNAPVVSTALLNAHGKRMTKHWVDPRRRHNWQAKMHQATRAWPIVERAVKGTPHSKIASDLHLTQSTICYRARQLGFHGQGCIYHWGGPFDSDVARLWREAIGLESAEIAAAAGLPKPVLDGILYPHRVHQHQRSRGEKVKKLIDWSEGILARLLADNSSRGRKFFSCSRPSILSSLVPHLREYYALLLSVLRRLRRFLRENQNVGLETLQDHLCEEARIEIEQESKEKLFARFLPWSPELSFLLERDLARLRSPGPLEQLACEWLAARCHTIPSVVREAIKGRTRPIPSDTMANLIRWLKQDTAEEIKTGELILSLDRHAQPAPAAGEPQKKSRRQSFTERVSQAKYLHEQKELSWPTCAKMISPDKDPKIEGELLRKAVQARKRRQKAHQLKAQQPG